MGLGVQKNNFFFRKVLYMFKVNLLLTGVRISVNGIINAFTVVEK